jgi:hypothetical protein
MAGEFLIILYLRLKDRLSQTSAPSHSESLAGRAQLKRTGLANLILPIQSLSLTSRSSLRSVSTLRIEHAPAETGQCFRRRQVIARLFDQQAGCFVSRFGRKEHRYSPFGFGAERWRHEGDVSVEPFDYISVVRQRLRSQPVDATLSLQSSAQW